MKLKAPRIPISVGDRVRKRGFAHLGRVDGCTVGGWATVTWDDGMARERPRFCDPNELELVDQNDAPPV